MLDHLQKYFRAFMTPIARVLHRWGVGPDAITIGGTIVAVALAMGLLPTGHVMLGGVLIGVFALFDSLDGTLARLSGRTGPWGAFLDATLDRITDGAVFAGIAAWFMLHQEGAWQIWGMIATLWCMALGAVVPYAHARAEAVGASARVGLTGRADRLVIALTPLGFTQFGLPVLVLLICLTLLALTTFITVWMRIAVVRKQLGSDEARNAAQAEAEALALVGPVDEMERGDG
ncbi:MAG: CDP-alcohol phosphatidyltransferase family protein [Promicromonosporaceae bacterium]|nr:CDP-alcohol phosphatidyltransferase family protein [Promicromonosporaceae bacterium]